MADVLNRATLQLHISVNTPDFPVAQYVINPDLTPVAGVPNKYWDLTGDILSEMTQPEKDVVDAAELAAKNAATEALIKSRIDQPVNPLLGLSTSVAISGLDLTVNINTVVVDDLTTVVADGVLTKRVNVTYILNRTSDSFSIEVFQRLVGNGDSYEDFAADEELAGDLGEWEVVASGTVLTPV